MSDVFQERFGGKQSKNPLPQDAKNIAVVNGEKPTAKDQKEGRRKNCSLSHAQFYQACNALKEDKARFLDQKPNHAEAAEMLSKLCGFQIAKGTVVDLKEATGVKWQSQAVGHSSLGSRRGNAIRTLTIALSKLYKELGVDPPNSLVDLHRCYQPDPVVGGPDDRLD